MDLIQLPLKRIVYKPSFLQMLYAKLFGLITVDDNCKIAGYYYKGVFYVKRAIIIRKWGKDET